MYSHHYHPVLTDLRFTNTIMIRVPYIPTKPPDHVSVKKKCGQDVNMNARAKNDVTKNDTLSQSRQLITARRMSKLAKGENLVFLAIVKETNYAPPR